MSSVIQLDLDSKLSEKSQKIIGMTMQSLDTLADFGIGSVAFDMTRKVVDEAEQKTKAIIDAMIATVENTIGQLLESGVQNLYSAIGLNEETINTARSIIKLADNATNLLSSGILQGILKLNKFTTMTMPMNAAVAGMQIIMSVAQLFYRAYLEAYQIYLDMMIELIIDPGSVLELLKDSLEIIIKKIEDFIDEQVYMYTGFHIIEIKRMCITGYNYYKQWKELLKELRTKDRDTQIEASASLNVKVNPDVMKQNMLNWLKAQGDAIYNSFMILQIIDAIKQIKETISGLTDVSLNRLADNINSLDDLVILLDELGLGDESTSVDLSMLAKFNINTMMNSLNNFKDMAGSLATSATLATAAAIESGIKIDASVTASKTFDVNTDFSTKTISVTIYKDPTSPSMAKSLYKVFTDSKTSDGKKIFSLGQAKLIQDNINKLWKDNSASQKGNVTIPVNAYTVKIELNASDDNGASKSLSKTFGNSNLPDKQDKEPKQETQKNPLEGFILNLDIGEEVSYTEEQIMQKRATTRRNTIKLLHTVFSMLKSIFPILKEVAVLIQNYKINKAYCQQKSKDNVFALFKELMNKLSLNKHIQTDVPDSQGRLTSMYTVRTLSLYNYLKDELRIDIKSDTVTYNVTDYQVKEIDRWLKNNDKSATPIETDKNIVLFIDFKSISDESTCLKEKYQRLSTAMSVETMEMFSKSCVQNKNGTFEGIDNIEIDDNNIFYSEKYLPRMPSQILMAQMHGCKPY